MIEYEQALYEIASIQGGYFTAAQALNAGYSYRAQNYRVNSGAWEKVDRGIFRLHNYPYADRPDLIRLTLWSHNQKGEVQAVASHETALAIHDISDVMPQKIHLTVPRGFRKPPPSYVILHVGNLEAKGIEQREGYLVTTPLQTIIDVANAPISQEHLNRAVKDAIERGMVRHTVLKRLELSGGAAKRLTQALEAQDD